MNPLLISTTADKFITAFSWMLIHSLWQGLLLSIIAGAVLMLNKKWGAVYRYNLALVLFMAFTGICLFTFMLEWRSHASAAIVRPIAGAIGSNVSALFSGNVNNIRQLTAAFTRYFTQNSPLIVMVWFMFFLFKSVKMISCMVYNQRIRTRQVYAPDQFWADAVATLSKKLQIRKAVQLFQSGYIKMPVVIGHLKPIILIPVGLMASLPAEQVEAILLHELAHIRRNDYFVNFLQNIAEAVFFFNPGLLWLSSLLREERENCCDDVALAQTNNKKGFVEALISFKEYELYGSKYATAFPGKKNYLLRRVSRILSNNNKTFGMGEKIFFTVSLVMLSVVVTTATVSQIKTHKLVKVMRADTHKVAAKKTTIEINIVNINHSKTTVQHIASQKPPVMIDGIGNIAPKTKQVAAVSIPAIATTVITTVNRQEDVPAERDQATNDQAQALRDQQQALRDQEQANIDRAQAIKDQQQAKIDRQQAEDDRARQNQIQQKKNHDQAVKNKEQERLNAIQARKNEEQAARNQEQARLNQIQDGKNQEQARLNQIQANKNQRAAKSTTSVEE